MQGTKESGSGSSGKKPPLRKVDVKDMDEQFARLSKHIDKDSDGFEVRTRPKNDSTVGSPLLHDNRRGLLRSFLNQTLLHRELWWVWDRARSFALAVLRRFYDLSIPSDLAVFITP